MQVISNFNWRNFIYGYELPESVRADFDYLDDDEFATRDFIKYRGVYYDTCEILRVPETDSELSYWDGYSPDTYFSGIVVKFSDDGEQYQIGRYLS